MAHDYSIPDAEDHLPEAVRAAERGDTVTLTRRGKPVAVLVSVDRFHGLQRSRSSFWESAEDLRRKAASQGVVFEEGDFEGLRDPSPGRDVDV